MNRAVLLLVMGMILLVTMGISSLVPILPALASEFGVPLEQSWQIIAAFAFPGLVCIPFVGIWADRYGRKKVLIPSLLFFCFGGLSCMFAQTYGQLLFCRIVQGAGSAPLGLLYPTIIADTWEKEERVKAMSLAAMTLGIGTAVSPALGGALGMINWRLPFLLTLLALPVLLLALRVPLMLPRKRIAFSRYIKDVVQTARERQTLVLLALTLLTFMMLSGPIITCFPLLAEGVFRASPWQSGLIVACASLAAGISATRLPWLYRHASTRGLLLGACVFYTLGFFALAFAPTLWWLLPAIFIYGLAQGINIPLVSLLLVGQAPDEQRASLMAANAVLLRLGQNVGPALFGTLAGILGPAGAIWSGTAIAVVMAVCVMSTQLPEVHTAHEGKGLVPHA